MTRIQDLIGKNQSFWWSSCWLPWMPTKFQLEHWELIWFAVMFLLRTESNWWSLGPILFVFIKFEGRKWKRWFLEELFLKNMQLGFAFDQDSIEVSKKIKDILASQTLNSPQDDPISMKIVGGWTIRFVKTTTTLAPKELSGTCFFFLLEICRIPRKQSYWVGMLPMQCCGWYQQRSWPWYVGTRYFSHLALNPRLTAGGVTE